MTTKQFDEQVIADIRRNYIRPQYDLDRTESHSAWVDEMFSDTANQLFESKPLGKAWERVMGSEGPRFEENGETDWMDDAGQYSNYEGHEL